ncbi:MAG TPA: ABC transporter ATP-binding protein [Anaerohalosphaeraceae bacterium]|nr:ABC transporter ATP-binding protein [Phycisphaerae bacterium]HOL30527.1 ABC transporter ATP-binding protein [Anaerohalosphaeraceae bacterium]HOM75222.1 ABC transporter ATP-binding protein [Anaerohalosphaeraceae bacterium]HPC63985.1 ABC transporter ATP-binding protein [Anaerohalosphaeraceae bacterium]HRS70921.1 ABC transporter ATP-binding protein [Anaerohalosphaeraceae bacterium]
MIKYYIEFFKYFGKGYKRYIPLVIVGAAAAGLLEIAGLMLLLPFIRILVRPESVRHHRWLMELMRLFGVQSPLQQACFLGGLIVFLFVAKNIYLLFYYFWQNKILRRWKIEISTALMRFYLLAPYKLHLLKTTEKITRNVNHIAVHALNNFVLQGFLLISNIIAGLIILSVLITRFFLFAVITAGILTAASLCQYYFLKRKFKSLGAEKSALMSEQYKNIFQGLHAIKETKVLGREQFFLDSFDGINRATMDNDMWTQFYHQFPHHLTEITAILCVVVMCIGVIHSTLGDNPAMVASLGILAAIAFRTSSIVNRILKALQQINHSQHAVEVLLEEVQSPLWRDYLQAAGGNSAGQDPAPLDFQKEIRFENVSYTYPGAKRPALCNVSVVIKKGEYVGIVGESGAGKTTFVDILLGLLEPEEGRVWIDSAVLAPDTVRRWQRRLGYVPQQVYIANDTVIRNVAFGLPNDQIDVEAVEKVLKMANLYDYVMGLGNKLETTLGENGRKLSGGEKQRIGIARALYYQADVLVLDEATSSLDVPTESEIARSISSLKGRQTIIAIAHRLSTLKSCDRILYFDKHRLVDTGTFESLSEKYEKFRQMVEMSTL